MSSMSHVNGPYLSTYVFRYLYKLSCVNFVDSTFKSVSIFFVVQLSFFFTMCRFYFFVTCTTGALLCGHFTVLVFYSNEMEKTRITCIIMFY